MSVIFDDELVGDFFGNNEQRRIFASDSRLQSWLDTEAALAMVQAELGVIPQAAANRIRESCDASLYSLTELREQIALTQHPIVPVVHALETKLGKDTARFVHFGATTQDIMDTGQSLQLKKSIAAIERDVRATLGALAALCSVYRDTPQAGRTHGQHAVPITFGLKVATWLDELHRFAERLEQSKPRVLAVQIFGAAGTAAAYGETGPAVRAGIARALGLADPGVPWHATRDRIAELASVMAALAAVAERIAAEVIRLQSTEFGEVREPLKLGHVGSSTMPQKLNPHLSEAIVAKARILQGVGATIQRNGAHQHERDMGAWAVEWLLVPELMVLAGATAAELLQLSEGITVDPERMRSNLDITGGKIVAENLMMRLDEVMGRDQAHAMLVELTRKANSRGGFRAAAASDPRIAESIPLEELEAILDPTSYTGHSADVADRSSAEHLIQGPA